MRGRAFNIGGGPQNIITLIKLVNLIEGITGDAPKVIFDEWRQADQRFYVSDFRRFTKATGWTPKIGVRDGVSRLYQWLLQSRGELSPSKTPRHEIESVLPIEKRTALSFSSPSSPQRRSRVRTLIEGVTTPIVLHSQPKENCAYEK